MVPMLSSLAVVNSEASCGDGGILRQWCCDDQGAEYKELGFASQAGNEAWARSNPGRFKPLRWLEVSVTTA